MNSSDDLGEFLNNFEEQKISNYYRSKEFPEE